MSRTERQTYAEEEILDAREESVSSNEIGPEPLHEDEEMDEDKTDKASDDDEIQVWSHPAPHRSGGHLTTHDFRLRGSVKRSLRAKGAETNVPTTNVTIVDNSNRSEETPTPHSRVGTDAPGIRGKRKMSDNPQTPAKRRALATPLNTVAIKDPPDRLIKPDAALHRIASVVKKSHMETVLTYLFFSIAGPFSIRQLSDACTWGRTSTPRSTDTEGPAVYRTVRALDWMDTQSHVLPYLRRFHLVQLCKHQRELQERFHKGASRDGDGSAKYGFRKQVAKKPWVGTKRAAREALDELMRQAHPESTEKHSAEYGEKLKAIQNRLSLAHNWHVMQRMLGIGVLALVPTGRDVGFTNAEYVRRLMIVILANSRSIEKTPQAELAQFLKILNEHRGKVLKEMSALISEKIYDVLQGRGASLLFDFEATTPDELTEAQYDSPALVRWCRPATTRT